MRPNTGHLGRLTAVKYTELFGIIIITFYCQHLDFFIVLFQCGCSRNIYFLLCHSVLIVFLTVLNKVCLHLKNVLQKFTVL